MFLPYIIVNAAHLCSASLFNGQDLNSRVHQRPRLPFSTHLPSGIWKCVCVCYMCETGNLLHVCECMWWGGRRSFSSISVYSIYSRSMQPTCHTSCNAYFTICCLTVLLRYVRIALKFILGLRRLLYMKAHSINLSVYWGFWTVCFAQLDFPLRSSSLSRPLLYG